MIRAVHIGKVLDNDDPTQKGGLKVQVDALEDGAALAGGEFVPPSFPFAGANVGFFFLPAKGALVEVEVESEPERGTEDLSARWRAVLYTDRDAIPAEFLTDQTNRGGIKFGKLVLLFDQKQDVLALISAKVRLGEEGASHPLVRGDTYNQRLSTYLTAENAFLTTLASLGSTSATAWGTLETAATGPLAPLAAAFKAHKDAWVLFNPNVATYKAANAAFKAALTSWLSTKAKTE